jgi:Glycosyltransferase family 92
METINVFNLRVNWSDLVRLQDCLPVLAAIVFLLNIFGYFIGYVQFRTYRDEIIKPVFTENPSYPPPAISQPTATAGPGVYSTYSGQPISAQTWKPSTVQCPVTSRSGRKRDDGRWYDFSVVPFQFYAYSAIWDDRAPSQLSRPVIRIIAVSSSRNTAGWSLQYAQPVNIDMSCRLYYADGRTVVLPMDPYAHPIGWGWTLNREMVREFIFTCPSSASNADVETPVAVEVLLGYPSWLYDVKESCMPIEFPEKPQVKRDLAICVQVSYGTLNALKLVEWLELQRLLGAQMIGIYNMSIADGPSADVLRYYSQKTTDGLTEPFIDLRRSDYIKDGPQQYLLHGSPVINDCVYRHMHRFKHIAVVDFDEVSIVIH